MTDALGDLLVNLRLDVWSATGWYPSTAAVVALVAGLIVAVLSLGWAVCRASFRAK